MPWVQQNLAANLPQDFAQLVASAETVQGNLQLVVDTLKTAMTVAKAFATTNIDPTSALAQAIITEIENVIDDFFNSGFSMLVITPNDLSSVEPVDNPVEFPFGIAPGDVPKKTFDVFGVPTMTPAAALSAAVASFDDRGDTRRPQFSNLATVTGFGILATAVSLAEMSEKIQGLISILNLDGFSVYLKQIQRAQPQPPVVVKSTLPDWRTTKLSDIPGFSDVHIALKGYINQFRGYLTTGDRFLDDFISAVDHKVNSITKAINELNSAIDTVVGGIGATGVYFLDIPQAVGGNAYLKAQLPDSTLSSLRANLYTVAVFFVAGGADTTGMDNFKSVFG